VGGAREAMEATDMVGRSWGMGIGILDDLIAKFGA